MYQKTVDIRQPRRLLFMSVKKPAYTIQDIQGYIDSGKVIIKEPARSTAKRDFGWDVNDIINAIKGLKIKHHYYKTRPHDFIPKVNVDYYKAHNYKGVNLYTHFHVQNGKLVITSCKEI